MTIEIRPPGPDELGEFLVPIAHAMGSDLREDGSDRLRALVPAERLLAAYEDGAVVGTTGAYLLELTVPGAQLPAAGVAWAAVLPSHRRRGILTQLMRRQLDEIHHRGEPLAALWSSEAQIYGRFGYGMASLAARAELARDRARFFDGDSPSRRVPRLVGEDEAIRLMSPVYDLARRGTPGMLSRSEEWWRRRRLDDSERSRGGAGPLQRAVLEVDGEIDAYALYRVAGAWKNMVPAARLDVVEALGASPEAVREVWAYLFGIDLVETISAGFLPVDHPLTLLVSEPNRLGLTLTNALWLRLVDVGAALAKRSYAAEGSVVLEVADGFCPWNEARWVVAAGPDGAEAERTTREPDLVLDVRDLGSVYLGGFGFGDLVRAGRAEEVSQGAASRADLLFRTERAPWTPEIF